MDTLHSGDEKHLEKKNPTTSVIQAKFLTFGANLRWKINWSERIMTT